MDAGWWQLLAILGLMAALLPLTILVCILWTRYLVARRERSPGAARVALRWLVLAMLPWSCSFVTVVVVGGAWLLESRSRPAVVRHSRTLVRDEKIGKLTFPAGSVVDAYNLSFEPLRVTLPEPTTIASLPVRGLLQVFARTGIEGHVTLTRDTTIGGVPCAAADDVIFASGRLLQCRLTVPVRIEGVPCEGVVNRGGGVSCTLASPYRSRGILYAAGTHWAQTNVDRSYVAITGDEPPDFLVSGKNVARDSVIVWSRGNLAVNEAVTSMGCEGHTVTLHVATRKVTLEGTGCRVALPFSTFSFARPLAER